MYQKILVPVDGSPTSNLGLREAIALAKLTGGQLHLLHVIDELSLMVSLESGLALTSEMLQLLEETGQQVLSDALAEVHAAGLKAQTELYHGFGGRVADHILAKCREWGAELIVLGTHGRRGVGRILLGSDAEQVLRKATVPVLLVRGT